MIHLDYNPPLSADAIADKITDRSTLIISPSLENVAHTIRDIMIKISSDDITKEIEQQQKESVLQIITCLSLSKVYGRHYDTEWILISQRGVYYSTGTSGNKQKNN